MHYYKLNIPTWTQSTRHLLPEEEGVYLRLVNHYYDTEQPIPEDLHPILRRLQLLPYKDIVDGILVEFFDKSEKGWEHKKIEHILKDFRKNTKKNRLNGAMGGRPRQDKALSISQSQPTGLPVASQSEPNDKPKVTLTTNHKPRATNHKPRAKGTVISGEITKGENKVSTGSIPFETITKMWNSMAAKNGLPQVIKITSAMKGQIRQRHTADLDRDLIRWDNFFKYIENNDFLAGRAEPGRDRSTPFRATLLWVTNETNFQKIAAKEFDQ